MATEVKPARSNRYETDFAAWAEHQAEALRAGRLDELDLENLAEEIGDLSNRERDAIESHLETLVMHLLKWRYRPDRCSRSWEGTIKVARRNIAKLLRRSPSLRRELPALLDEVLPQRTNPGRRRDGFARGHIRRHLPLHPRPGDRRLAAVRSR